MKFRNRKRILLIVSTLCLFIYTLTANAIINIVAAENIYGEVAKEIGGAYVSVISILNHPNQNPHIYSTSLKNANAVKQADIVVYNGMNYDDDWMMALLSLKGKEQRKIIIVSKLIHAKEGTNPYIWYQPSTIPTYANYITETLSQISPENRDYFHKQLDIFKQKYLIIDRSINYLKQHFHGTPIIATHPIFNDMAKDIGFQMHGEQYQENIINNMMPTLSEIKTFEEDLRNHVVSLLIFKKTFMDPISQKMVAIAKEEKIPVVEVTERMPANSTYIQWMLNQLLEIKDALDHHKSD